MYLLCAENFIGITASNLKVKLGGSYDIDPCTEEIVEIRDI